ncbi:MAG: GIY-YIG nuclease family protein [Clostridiales bacterium]|nr:GIY-YIG nuclease family protein [Clostridiales bacterium]
MQYFVYMLRCSDNSIYTGYTTDICRRVKEHYFKSPQGAKYTKSHNVIRVERVWQTDEKKKACKAEYMIKRLEKKEKEGLIKEPEKLCSLLGLNEDDFNTIEINLEKCIKNNENTK